MRILLIPIPPRNITCSRAAHAAATVEDNLLIKSRFLEAEFFLELFPIHVQRRREAGEREIDCRGNHALQYLIGFPYINQILILDRNLGLD